MTDEFLAVLAKRRTYYHLDKAVAAPRARIQEIVEQVVRSTPSAFNMQSARVILLFGAHHDELWRIAEDALRKIVPPEAFEPTRQKIAGFAAAAGTILYFDDTGVIEAMQEKFPTYKENFPVWAQQANGMTQAGVWNAMTEEGLGASLQHYNPLIDDAVKARWNAPARWKLVAQMPFGNPTAPPDPKESMPVSERVMVYQ